MYTKTILYTNKQKLHKHDPGTASVVLKLRHTRRQPSTYLQRRESPTATFPLETHTFLEILPKLSALTGIWCCWLGYLDYTLPVR